jgi:hypothetical protein
MTVMMNVEYSSGFRDQGSFTGEVTVWTHDSLNRTLFRCGGIDMVVSLGQRENGGFMASFRGEG